MKRAARSTRRSLVTRGTAAAVATVAAVTAAGVGGAAPAVSAVGPACPDVFSQALLTEGQPVTGLTVTEGTIPEEFTGEVVGVLNDGIALGMDMIIMRLSSPEIDRVGVWSGMSGSPVYAANGDLIGAVSHTLTWGSTQVAGVTPAADMAAVMPRLQRQAAGDRIALPSRLQARLVARGDATAREAGSGLSPLTLPLGISGLGGQRRYDQIGKSLRKAGKSDGLRAVRMGSARAAGLDATDIVAGGNIAAAIAYGDVTYAALGTATMVCDDEVVGFGHPFMWAGPTSLSMHPASALYIQEDAAYSGFKVGNIGAPAGTIDQDRLAGIAGSFGAAPESSRITTSVTSDRGSREGTTDVYLPDWMPDVALSALLANEDRVFDGIGKGSGEVSFTINGLREDGTPFSVGRSDLYADSYDLTWATVMDLYITLAQIEYNDVEDVTITDVDADATLTRDYRHQAIKKAYIKQHGEWLQLGVDVRRVTLNPGRDYKIRVEMKTPDGTVSEVVSVPVRKKDRGQRGVLRVEGGNSGSWWDDFYFFEDEGSGSEQTFDDTLESIEKKAHNDDIVTKMMFWMEDEDGNQVVRQERTGTGTVTDGRVSVRVKIAR